jgi:putative drug exporter of the RND superfamily
MTGKEPAIERLSGFLLRHKPAVLLFWLAVLVVGVLVTPSVEQRVSNDFSLPGQPGYEANEAIARIYGSGGHSQPIVPVVHLPAGRTVDDPRVREGLRQAFATLSRDLGVRVASYATGGDRRFVSPDGRTTFALVSLPTHGGFHSGGDSGLAPRLAAATLAALPPGSTVRVTGIDELTAAGSGNSGDTSVLTLTLVGGLGALAVLALVFGSLLALAPLLVAAVSILATFLVVVGLTTFTEVNVIVEYLVALIGLGVAIDYSLLLVTRWREERAHGHHGDEAVRRAMATAGRAVVLSGSTVAVGLLSMVVLPIPFLRSVGYAGMLIPLLSALVTVTLQPVLLAGVGQRLDWPRRRLRKEATGSRAWTAWARGVVRARWAALVVAVAVLALLGGFAPSLRTGTTRADALADAGPAHEGLGMLQSAGIPAGVLEPIEVLVPQGTDPAALATRLARLPGVWTAAAPDGPGWRRDGTALVSVQPAAEPSSKAGAQAVDQVRTLARHQAPGVQVGGPATEAIDFSRAVYGRFLLMLAVIAAITFVLLARAFRSLLLAAKAIAVDLLSIGAVFGAMVLVWQQGHGSQAIAGIPATGAIDTFIPLMVFAFLFGLSMDYEVFLLTRIREAYDRTGSTTDAVVQGVGRTGRLVTSAALILFLAFASLAAAPQTEIKVFATALGAGILLDATLVRSLLVPALVAILGRWNWWLPAWAARPLRVAPSITAPHAPTDQTEAARG